MDLESNEIDSQSLRHAIHLKLKESGLYDQISQIVNSNDELDELSLVEKIKQNGLLESMVEKIKLKGTENKIRSKTSLVNKLKLSVRSLKGFLDYDNTDGDSDFFSLDILFYGQRFTTKSFFMSTLVNLDESFIFNLNPYDYDVDLTLNTLKKSSTRIHLVLVKINEKKEKKIISTKSIEWRMVLCSGVHNTTAKLYNIDTFNSSPNGLIEIDLSLVDAKDLISEVSIREQIKKEKKFEKENNEEFISYINDWWEDYKKFIPQFSSRLIRIFIPTEDKENNTHKFPCTLLEPIYNGRGLKTPYEASRFVSLIPYERNEFPGGGKNEIWKSAHSILSIKKGDIEDHSLLLCSLLLGFSLDSYVAIGVSVNGPHIWVLTRGKIQNNKFQITFWESLTGQRINLNDDSVFGFYKQIHCVFNDSHFYANIQIKDDVMNIDYNLDDEFLWKAVNPDRIRSLRKYCFNPAMDIKDRHSDNIEANIERLIKRRICIYRKELGLKTIWDNKLAYVTSPALCNYEFERISNLTYGNEEFKQSIKNYVEEGYTFKGFPFHSSDQDDEKIFNLILLSPIGRDIICSKGGDIIFALRCKEFVYPQDVYSIWIMFCVKLKQNK